jgi:hypothetical protein
MATVKVNGVAYDFKNLEVAFVGADGQQFGINTALEEISYSFSIEREKFYGGARIPILRTEGQAEFEAACSMARFWWTFIVKKARELGIPIAGLRLNLAVSYVTSGEEVLTDTLSDVAIAGLDQDHSNGAEHLMAGMELDPMNIYYQGVDVFGNKL